VPSSVKLPDNLFIIGTVNIDETTYMFSPKVLDRANVIEFRVSAGKMKSYFKTSTPLDMNSLREKGASMGHDFVNSATSVVDPANELETSLMPFFTKLQEVGSEFGYRTASEISRFVTLAKVLQGSGMTEDSIIDAAIMQKLLPKVHGSRSKIEPILKKLGKLCLTEETNEPFQLDDNKDAKYPLSYDKLTRMHRRVIADGFTSFAEA
jgi:5-methylcytosine-specific restriction protein B